MHKLHEALSILGYGKTNQPHCRSNLIHAILMFAESLGDQELVSACEEEIANIREEAVKIRAEIACRSTTS